MGSSPFFYTNTENQMQHLRRAVVALSIAAVLVAVGATGCGDDPLELSEEYDGFAHPDDLPDDDAGVCEVACERVYSSRSDDGCQQSFTVGGDRLSEDECVDACANDDLMHGSQRCVAASAECKSSPDDLVDACYGPYVTGDEVPDDDEGICELACERIYAPLGERGCFQQFSDDDGRSLNEEGCVDACLEEDLMDGEARCVALAEECRATPEEQVDDCAEGPPPSEACAHLGPWDSDAAEMEEEVLQLVNQHRAEGANCGTQGSFDPVDPLEMDEELRCAARLHSMDQEELGDIFHDHPETGETPAERIADTNYMDSPDERMTGENVAMGSQTAEQVMQGWMDSDGHCANIMQPDYQDLGVGMYHNYWTQKFGGPGMGMNDGGF